MKNWLTYQTLEYVWKEIEPGIPGTGPNNPWTPPKNAWVCEDEGGYERIDPAAITSVGYRKIMDREVTIIRVIGYTFYIDKSVRSAEEVIADIQSALT